MPVRTISTPERMAWARVGYSRTVAQFPFRFTTPYRIAGLPFGITPGSAAVEVTADELRIRFGPWKLRTPLGNVEACTETGPFQFVKTAGPAHLSLADRGMTCATNGDRGLCISFRDAVPGIDPLGRIRHPAVTVTVEEPAALASALRAATDAPT